MAERAQKLLERDRFSDLGPAVELIRRARALATGPPEEVDRLRLLEAELRIFLQAPDQSLSLSQAPLAPASGKLEPRRQMLIGAGLRSANPEQARRHLETASEAARLAGDLHTEAMCWIFQGQIQLDKEPAKSLDAYRRAEALATQASDARTARYARFNLGRAYIDLGEYDLSLGIFQEVAAAAKARQDDWMWAMALDNQVINYLNIGDYERALDLSLQSGKVFDAAGAERAKTKVISLGTRAWALWALDRRPEAVGYFRQAVTMARTLGENAELRRRLDALVQPLVETGQAAEAAAASQEVFALYEKDRALSVSSESLLGRGFVREAQQQRDEARNDFLAAIQSASPTDTEVKRDAEFGLARLAAARHDRAEARRRFETAIALAESQRAGLASEDSQLTFLESVIAIYRYYAAILSQWGDEDGALRVEESSRARLVANRVNGPAPPVRIDQLRSLAARSRSLFLAYWIAEGGSHVRVIGPSGYERVPLAVNTARLADLVREHNELIERGLGDPRKAGRAAAELYRILVEPIAAKIPPGGRVVIVPDAALHRLNFETIVRSRDSVPGFWIEDVTIQVAPSLSLLQQSAPVRSGSHARLLLMGDALPSPEFGRLDHAGSEMKVVKSVFGEAAVTERSGAAAVPSAFAAVFPAGFSHIHFTAHAQANRESPLDSAVILSPEPEGPAQGRYQLRARAISGLSLKADLVTVSACHSAGDRAVQGEGLVGFAWAFLRTGANNVVVGLWDVNDRSTTLLMEKLYAGIRAGDSAADALRKAKLSMIADGKTYAKPYYWAPFQLYSRGIRI